MLITPKRPFLIDLDEGFFYCIIFFFFFLQKKKSGYKGESGVSCLAQLEIPTRGKKKFKMAFAEVPHTRGFFLPFQSFFLTLEIYIFFFS